MATKQQQVCPALCSRTATLSQEHRRACIVYRAVLLCAGVLFRLRIFWHTRCLIGLKPPRVSS